MLQTLVAFCSLSSLNCKAPYQRAFVRTIYRSTSLLETASNLDHHNNNIMFSSQKEAQIHASKVSKENVVKCGDLACQHDSFLQTLSSAKIINHSTFTFEEKKVGKKKKSKKNKGEPIVDTVKERFSPVAYAITLSDSLFFPEGGGQFADKGSIVIKSKKMENNEDMELFVQDVNNIDEVCVLLCRVTKDFSHEDFTNILEQNDEDIEVVQKLDWDRRFDQMTQHSGQHLCSAVALTDFDISTHTFSLGDKMSYIDFTIDESWDKEYAAGIFSQIEMKVNMHIRENLSMTPTWLDRDDPLFETKVRSRLLPEGLKGKLRLVEIQGLDLNTCCGTHTPSLGHLQMIKFFRMEKVKSTIFRVHFAAAKRLNAIMNNMYDTQANLTSKLSCTDTEQVQRVTQLLDEKRDQEKAIRLLNEKLSNLQSKEVLEECKSSKAKLATVDLGDVDMNYMTLIATKVLNDDTNDEKSVFLFIGCPEGSDEGSFLLVGDKSIVDKTGKEVATMLNGRGGGRNGKFQGKGNSLRSSLGAVKEYLTSSILESQ